jgi:hypothetical protein
MREKFLRTVKRKASGPLVGRTIGRIDAGFRPRPSPRRTCKGRRSLAAQLVVTAAPAGRGELCAAAVTSYNSKHYAKLAGHGGHFYAHEYLLQGPQALPALQAALARPDLLPEHRRQLEADQRRLYAAVLHAPTDWQSWTWRQHRLIQWLDDVEPRWRTQAHIITDVNVE